MEELVSTLRYFLISAEIASAMLAVFFYVIGDYQVVQISLLGAIYLHIVRHKVKA